MEKTHGFNCIHLILDHFATAHCTYLVRSRVHFKEEQQLQIIYISHWHPGCACGSHRRPSTFVNYEGAVRTQMEMEMKSGQLPGGQIIRTPLKSLKPLFVE